MPFLESFLYLGSTPTLLFYIGHCAGFDASSQLAATANSFFPTLFKDTSLSRSDVTTDRID